MTYNKKRHQQLIRLSQELYSQGINFFLENPKEWSELCAYNIAVEEQVYWTHRKDFLIIMKNFIDDIIDFDEFETEFSILVSKTMKEVQLFKNDLKQIEKFQPSTRSDRFASYIISIFRQFESVEDEYCTEEEVKDYVKETYFKFQKFLTEE